jgi:pentatricopeptide repeat protein
MVVSKADDLRRQEEEGKEEKEREKDLPSVPVLNTLQCNALMSSLNRCGRPRDALLVFAAMDDGNRSCPETERKTERKTELETSTRTQTAPGLLNTFNNSPAALLRRAVTGAKLDLFSFAAALSAWERAGEWKEAESLFHGGLQAWCSRQQPQARPATVHFNSLLSALSKADQLDAAEELLRRMQADAQQDASCAHPDRVSFFCLAAGMERAGRLTDARAMKARAQAVGRKKGRNVRDVEGLVKAATADAAIYMDPHTDAKMLLMQLPDQGDQGYCAEVEEEELRIPSVGVGVRKSRKGDKNGRGTQTLLQAATSTPGSHATVLRLLGASGDLRGVLRFLEEQEDKMPGSSSSSSGQQNVVLYNAALAACRPPPALGSATEEHCDMARLIFARMRQRGAVPTR